MGLDCVDSKCPNCGTVTPWKNGKVLVWDVSYSDTFAASYVDLRSGDMGVVSSRDEFLKKQKYTIPSETFTILFLLVLRPWIYLVMRICLIKELGRRIKKKKRKAKASFYLLQYLLVANRVW